MRAWRGAAVVALACSVAGCKTDPAAKKAEAPASVAGVEIKPAVALDPATLGVVSGTVRLVGKAPAPVLIDKSMDPACALGGDTYSEQYAVHDGKLGNVFVYVKDGPAAAMAMGASHQAPAVLDQKGCVYTPHVVGVTVGQPVEFRNSDSTMHNVHMMPTVAANEAVDVSQGPHGAAQTKVFKHAELMVPVRCNNHPWMNAFINISPTPFFAVSGADGQYELKGLPAGEYTLGLVQEKLGEQTLKVTVKAKGTAVADFSFAMQ